MVMKALIRLLLVIQWSLSLRSRDMVNSSVTFLVTIYNHIFTISITYKIRINRTWSYMYLWWVHIRQISQRRRTSRRNKTIVWECGRNQTLIRFGYSGSGHTTGQAQICSANLLGYANLGIGRGHERAQSRGIRADRKGRVEKDD